MLTNLYYMNYCDGILILIREWYQKYLRNYMFCPCVCLSYFEAFWVLHYVLCSSNACRLQGMLVCGYCWILLIFWVLMKLNLLALLDCQRRVLKRLHKRLWNAMKWWVLFITFASKVLKLQSWFRCYPWYCETNVIDVATIAAVLWSWRSQKLWRCDRNCSCGPFSKPYSFCSFCYLNAIFIA